MIEESAVGDGAAEVGEEGAVVELDVGQQAVVGAEHHRKVQPVKEGARPAQVTPGQRKD